MRRTLSTIAWIAVALAGASALATIAFWRGEPIGALWFIVAAGATYLLAYRFYSAFLAARVLALDDANVTPAVRLEDGRDFVPTNKWIVFGHHFAAIAGPGPLVGPTLAAQFGYLPGTLWLILGSVLAGCVQDFVILVFSLRRDGRSLGQIAREEMGTRAGRITALSILAIMIILLAVVALVVVNALRESPWGAFTLAATIPIAMLMGVYLRFWRPGRVLEASALGFGLLMTAVVCGQYVAASPWLAPYFRLSGIALASAVILYGFAASALPVWLLLAPRDYLSAFLKVGAIAALAAGILYVRPLVEMPALTRFAAGNGPVFPGTIFPFCFITIACGAISGFHALIASGTTPKLLMRETHARPIGYGAMLIESCVGIMAMIAACALPPGVYFAINSPASAVGATAEQAAATISSWGFPLEAATMHELARRVGEETLLHRAGGAPSLAVGMAQIFSGTIGGDRLLSIWYHFALMFEALFILTVLDAGTRVGRFMLQEMLGHVWAPLGRTSWYPGTLLTSALIALAWGLFLWQGVTDPNGGIGALWPLFGISNQLLGIVALVVATTLILRTGRARYVWVTLVPTAWLLVVTLTGAWQKLMSADPRIGFLAMADRLSTRLASGAVPVAELGALRQQLFNNRLDAVVTLVFVGLVVALLVEAALLWRRLLRDGAEGQRT